MTRECRFSFGVASSTTKHPVPAATLAALPRGSFQSEPLEINQNIRIRANIDFFNQTLKQYYLGVRATFQT